jgi:hypothetical protein
MLFNLLNTLFNINEKNLNSISVEFNSSPPIRKRIPEMQNHALQHTIRLFTLIAIIASLNCCFGANQNPAEAKSTFFSLWVLLPRVFVSFSWVA